MHTLLNIYFIFNVLIILQNDRLRVSTRLIIITLIAYDIKNQLMTRGFEGPVRTRREIYKLIKKQK